MSFIIIIVQMRKLRHGEGYNLPNNYMWRCQSSPSISMSELIPLSYNHLLRWFPYGWKCPSLLGTKYPFSLDQLGFSCSNKGQNHRDVNKTGCFPHGAGDVQAVPYFSPGCWEHRPLRSCAPGFSACSFSFVVQDDCCSASHNVNIPAYRKRGD